MLALVAITVIVGVYWGAGTIGHNGYDDYQIEYRYAVNFSEGRGLVFNEGEYADAASSFLYTIVLAVFYWFGFHNLELVSCILNLLSVACITVLVCLSAMRRRIGSVVTVMVSLVVTLHGFVSGWAVLAGDTVPWTALLVIWSYFTFINRRENLSALFTVLVVLMRFEGVLVLPVWYMEMRYGRKVSKRSPVGAQTH
jgi:hypothetical protein